MKKYVITNKCGGSFICIPKIKCPANAIEKGDTKFLFIKKKKINQNKCIKCGICYKVCPHKAIALEEAN